jgi:hypothetical protein
VWSRHSWGQEWGRRGGASPRGGGGMPGFIRQWVCMSIDMDEYRRLSKVYTRVIKRCKM